MIASSPRFYYLHLAGGLSADIRSARLREPDDGVTLLSPGPIRVTCDGRMWYPVMDNMEGIFICTKLLAEEMEAAGLRMGDQYPVEIMGAEGAIKRKPSPEYVYFRCRRGLAVSDEGKDWPVDHPRVTQGMFYRMMPSPDTWNGDDLFGVIGRNWASLMVSRRFVETVYQKRWDSFVFTALDLPYDLWHSTLQLNIGYKWPPVWYPEGVDPHSSNMGPMPEPAGDGPGPLEKSSETKGHAGSKDLKDSAVHSIPWDPAMAGEDKEDGLGSPTGHYLLGEPVRWGFPEFDTAPEVKDLITPYLDSALRVVEAKLMEENRLAREPSVPEVLEAFIEISSNTPEDGSDFLWELIVDAAFVGVCDSHFFTFRKSDLIDACSAD